MPEYVYALHDFSPENQDEVSFHAGERIEVIEKDDLYGDGWWQGRNLAGNTGLFPQSYTAPAPPTVAAASTPTIPTSDPDQSRDSVEGHESDRSGPVNGHKSEPSSDGAVMKATMTDVQKAIEQLGRNDRDGARSFSFASSRSRDGDHTDRETDTDIDTDAEAEGEDWHREARIKLAEQSRKVVEAQRQQEELEGMQLRTAEPPIEVELSDESEGEEDHADAVHNYQSSRAHPYIPEEDEDASVDGNTTASAIPADSVSIPSHEESEPATATARRTSFPTIAPPPPVEEEATSPTSLPTPTSPASPLPKPSTSYVDPYPPISDLPSTHATPTPSNANAAVSLPSPAASSAGHHARDASKHSSGASSAKLSSHAETPEVQSPKKANVHPTEWTVEEVVDWLKSKGFGDVIDKFIEQEITGDVLLELDVNLLKSEIGIAAFGKRMRIANAITDLRRPPSIQYSDHQPPALAHSQSTPHAANRSFAYSHSHSQSVQSSTHHSLNSPISGTPNSAGLLGNMFSPESPPHTGDLAGSPMAREMRRISDPGSTAGFSMHVVDTDDGSQGISGALERAARMGLGLGSPSALVNGKGKARPSQLTLSPSDSALNSKAVDGEIPEETDEERAAMSETETTPAGKQRRRMFGRSTGSDPAFKGDKRDSAQSKGSRTSKDGTSPLTQANVSPISEGGKGPRKSEEGSVASRHSRGKKSTDAGGKASDRLSLFGGMPTIGKSRKPAPRLSTFIDDHPSEKTSSLNLARLYGTTGKKSTGRVSSVSDSEKTTVSKEKEKDVRDPAILRKRTSSTQGSHSELPARGMGALKPGQSIIEQIGPPDHNGWMRKKGERYNSWKLRYFILKGPHLYYLRSNSKSETKIKGYINILGYKVIADESVNPGRYGFRIVHDTDKTHFFSSEEQIVVREWMKAIMKSTIGRDYSRPVVSSCNIPTIPLAVAQTMNPAPRPPSPTQRAATQKSFRRENPNQLSSRDARILMGLPSPDGPEDLKQSERARLDSFFTNETVSSQGELSRRNSAPKGPKNPPPRPSREMRRLSSAPSENMGQMGAETDLIEWANSHLPQALQITDPTGSLCGGLALLRLAEAIKGKASSPPVPNNAFPSGPNDDKLDGLFRLFDFLLDNDVKMGSVSINDVRQGKREKIIQLLKALRAWEDKRRAILQSIGEGAHVPSAFATPVGVPFGRI